jgi:hypothetical protein
MYMQVSDIHQFHTRNYGYMHENMDFIINSISMTSGSSYGNERRNLLMAISCQFLTALSVIIYIRT